MFRMILTAALAMPIAAFAAGSDSNDEPKPTETTTECDDGKVWDDKTQACVDAQDSRLDDDTLYGAVREFAYAGQHENSLRALAAMSEPQDDRVLTYLGYNHRKLGDVERGMAFYEQALAVNPDNLLARSYMGQAFVEQGKNDMARLQLAEIQARGGANSWPAEALQIAIDTGATFRY